MGHDRLSLACRPDPKHLVSRISTWMTEAATAPIVTLEGVSVAYGRNAVLRDVTASFPAGAVGLLGPNGAGKSTMLKALLGLLKPDTGSSRVLGIDVASRP